MRRVAIYVDGANFYLTALKPLDIKDADFDYERLILILANGRDVSKFGKRFYIGTVPEKEGDADSKAAISRQTTLFSRLRDNDWEIRTSIHKKKIETIPIDYKVKDYKNFQNLGIKSFTFEKYREKGIDVKLATDLIVGSIDDQYDVAVVVSSDTDLIPAIDCVRNRGKKVEYVGFSIPHPSDPKKDIKPTIAMVDRTDAPSRILIESDIREMTIGQGSIL